MLIKIVDLLHRNASTVVIRQILDIEDSFILKILFVSGMLTWYHRFDYSASSNN